MKKLIGFILSTLIVANLALAGPPEDKIAKALESGQQWLAQCDQAKYSESWEAAATYFKNAVKKEQWNQMVAAVRKPLGKMEKREVNSQKYQTTAPGAPDGEYVIIKFSTTFENKKESTETLTMMFEKDRGWRAAGYFVK